MRVKPSTAPGPLGRYFCARSYQGGGFHASPDDLLDLRVCFEPAGDLGGVLDVAFDAQGEVSRPMPMLKALVGEMAAPVSRSRETRAFRM